MSTNQNLYYFRGKPSGHDVDLLISHPTEGAEMGLLQRLLVRLNQLGLFLYGNMQISTFKEEYLRDDPKMNNYLKSTFDRFEKWIGIMKVNKTLRDRSKVQSSTSDQHGNASSGIENSISVVPDSCLDYYKHNSQPEGTTCDSYEPRPAVLDKRPSLSWSLSQARSERDWVARRVDLIITPANQYYYALVGWTGSKQFNRSLRLHAQRNVHARLSSHGCYDDIKARIDI